MKAGRMDRRLDLYSRSVAQDAAGQAIETFTLLATVWAEKVNPRGQELFAASQLSSQAMVYFRIRWRSDVAYTSQAVCEGITYNITSVGEIGRREGLELRCEQVLPHA